MEMAETKKKNGTKELEEQLAGLGERNAQLTSTAQNLANQLNTYMGLASQYEGTINAMTQRLQEKDNIIGQLNSQLTQKGGE